MAYSFPLPHWFLVKSHRPRHQKPPLLYLVHRGIRNESLPNPSFRPSIPNHPPTASRGDHGGVLRRGSFEQIARNRYQWFHWWHGACDILKKYTIYIVPNMCLDGSVRGHLRTNTNGQNLNREWAPTDKSSVPDNYDTPSIDRLPEVYHVLNEMNESRVDAFLHVHGDEELPFNFLAGSKGCPNWSSRLQALHGAFLASYSRVNSDMQRPVELHDNIIWLFIRAVDCCHCFYALYRRN